MNNLNEIYDNFPYENVYEEQKKFIEKVNDCLLKKENLLCCAPTGIGKTISAILPSLLFAKKNKKTIIFLTSRQTQINQAIKTIKDISSKENLNINYVSFLSKRNMCVHNRKDEVLPTDFLEHCKKLKERGECSFFKNSHNSEFEDDISYLIKKSNESFLSVEEFVKFVGMKNNINFCPYEIASKNLFDCDLVICDFNYVFVKKIRETFFGKLDKDLEDCILIIDEAHNLESRVRSSNSFSLTLENIKSLEKEILKYFEISSGYFDFSKVLMKCFDEIVLDKLSKDRNDFLIMKDTFMNLIDRNLEKLNLDYNCKSFREELFKIGRIVKEEETSSISYRIASFLEFWMEYDDEFYVRTLNREITKDKLKITLKINCIDPRPITKNILNNSYSSILMSATLTPLEMHKEILGIENFNFLELQSPFEKSNQLNLIINDVSTKYTLRTEDMFKRIARHIENVITKFDKNTIIFFPSYEIKDRIFRYINVVNLTRQNKIVLNERKFLSKEEKESMIGEFKKNHGLNPKNTILFGITSGSFSEGLDLSNKFLEMVLVVGLPFGVIDSITKAIINHYEKYYNKGQLYGYIYPTMSKIIQAAGRCIRTKEDKGVVLFLDSRFNFNVYKNCFPNHYIFENSNDYLKKIENFFEN